MHLIFRIAFLFLISVTAATVVDASGRKTALVIGNSGYLYAAPLANPTNDAKDISTKLTALGFEVVDGIDLSYVDLRLTVRKFIATLEGSEVALFYYAGHGMQVGGQNYMLPVDAQLRSEDDLEFEAITIASVLEAMERKSETNLVFLDACRDNPLAKTMSRSMGSRSAAVGRGLARQRGGLGTLISFSTQPGNVALDGEGRNSPYAEALLKHLGTPGQGILQSLIKVRLDVLTATGEQQVPWDSSSLTGEVVLTPSVGEEDAPITSLPLSAVGSSSRHYDEEIAMWQRIKDMNSPSAFKIYLEKFPDGLFAEVARAALTGEGGTTPGQTTSSAEGQSGLDAETLARLGSSLDRDAPPVPVRVSPETVEDGLNLSSDSIQKIQRALAAIGFDAGTPDGQFGARSRKALRRFQIASRIPETGYLDAPTVKQLLDVIEEAPVGFDGQWQIEFHRYNYASRDPGQINARTRLASANVDVRDGIMYIDNFKVFAQDRNSFEAFEGRISANGRIKVSTRLGALFGKMRQYSFTVTGSLPEIVASGRTFRFKGPKLWYWDETGEVVHVRMDMIRKN